MAEPLRLLGRADCGLCEELLEALHEEHPDLAVHWLDVDADTTLQRRYGLRVPVLLDAWNEVVCEGQYDAAAVAEWRRGQMRDAR